MIFAKTEIGNIYSSLRVRNIVLCGVLFFLVFKTLLGFVSAKILLPAYIILTAAFLLNFLAYVLLKSKKILFIFSYLQFVLDLVVIVLALYFSGGIENTWGFLMAVTIAISGLYFSFATAIFIAIMAIIAFGGMVWLEYLQIIPHFNAYGLDIWKNTPYVVDYFSAMLVLYVGSAVVSASAGYNLKKRKEDADAYAEELKKKIKTIEEFNRELRSKYADIERLNQLFVGRELEMVKLKEEIKELKKGKN
ncbi:hypothetical protein A2276_03230 [candidate division WOR-1 bacterium RIFOXYA12_FULL_43_27]|uniref:Uncharacterized protein n=1 Tax=candidate division WOR-1 bacterium RIFOXYC2_FULL_46_14 TaxID=1802587 RepID=A0A1F4U7E5_UNCSA|nr:MAG: hypothetical protein A2276_03230 [candidate division WOR-1 bacterium RIFOXYA12_FULL_43_27]OGC19285.1 MAG: hypothetical protein A2292_01105 [candidate division WOR-1 bacterium RIFOXYB2_FULL_46_45]OGC30274.1 MAG: hypothetical protein A2232_01105 [candidate division WOR-1 bacterium RIFOXYA2_FULL_46_56]OGC40875.1 MAG: hypothetical protein A2438_01105 [candidate division WOR-1 bacterium RIFOXYC2_FULL_46_14]